MEKLQNLSIKCLQLTPEAWYRVYNRQIKVIVFCAAEGFCEELYAKMYWMISVYNTALCKAWKTRRDRLIGSFPFTQNIFQAATNLDPVR